MRSHLDHYGSFEQTLKILGILIVLVCSPRYLVVGCLCRVLLLVLLRTFQWSEWAPVQPDLHTDMSVQYNTGHFLMCLVVEQMDGSTGLTWSFRQVSMLRAVAGR